MRQIQIRYDDGVACERMMGTWSRAAGEIFLDWPLQGGPWYAILDGETIGWRIFIQGPVSFDVIVIACIGSPGTLDLDDVSAVAEARIIISEMRKTKSQIDDLLGKHPQ